MPTEISSRNDQTSIFLEVGFHPDSEMDYKTLLVQQAQQIGFQTPNPVYLAVSGGLDSEAMALAFLESGVKFHVAIMRFDSKLNDHDIRDAEAFCQVHKIPYKFFDLDVLGFLKSGASFKYALDYGCTSPQVATHLWLREQTDAPIVFAGQALRFQIKSTIKSIINDAPVLFAQNFHEHLGLVEGLTHNEYLKHKNSESSIDHGYLNFLCKTPELRAALLILENPIQRFERVQQLCVQKDASHFGNVRYFQEKYIVGVTKYEFYRQAGLCVTPKPMKYTGFERVHVYYGLPPDKRAAYLKSLQDGNAHDLDSDFNTQIKGLNTFNELYREPMLKQVPQPKEVCLEFSASFLDLLRMKILTDWSPAVSLLKHQVSFL